MASLATQSVPPMSTEQQQTTSDAISGATDGANTAGQMFANFGNTLNQGVADIRAGAKAKQAELAQATANAQAKIEEQKQKAAANLESFKQGEAARRAENAAIQAQGQHAYLAHGWSGLKKMAAETKQNAIKAKKTLEQEKVVFDNAKADAHAKAVANFNQLPDVQLGQKTSDGTGQAGTPFEASGGRRRRRRRKSRKKRRKSKKRKSRKRKSHKRRRRGGVMCDVIYDDSTRKWEQEDVAGIYNEATGKFECPKIEKIEKKGNRYAKTIEGGRRRRRKSRKSKRKSRKKKRKRKTRKKRRRRNHKKSRRRRRR